MTRQEFADMCGIHIDTLNQYVDGEIADFLYQLRARLQMLECPSAGGPYAENCGGLVDAMQVVNNEINWRTRRRGGSA